MGEQKETATLNTAIQEVIDGMKQHVEKIGVWDNDTVKKALSEDLGQLLHIQSLLD